METLSSSQLQALWIEPLPPNGVITNYTVYCIMVMNMDQTPTEGDYDIVTVSTGAGLSAIVENLDAFTFYRCFVRAATSVGMGPGSNQVTTRTNQDSKYIVWENSSYIRKVL